MKYAILVYETADDFAARSDSEQSPGYWNAHQQFAQALEEAGVAAGGAGLQPVQAGKTIRIRSGRRTITDGPFAETKEMLGGMYLINVPSSEDALEWAEKCPSAATGRVELRPMMQSCIS